MTDKEKIAAIAFFSNLVDHDAEAWGYESEIPLFKTALEALESPRDWTPCAEGLPTTGEIVRALRNCADATGKRKPCTPECCFFNKTNCCAESLYSSAADRLESQEQKLELLNGGDFDVIDIPAALAYLESVEEILPHASALIDLIQSLKGTAIELTARAEQAEKERDEVEKSLASTCDKCGKNLAGEVYTVISISTVKDGQIAKQPSVWLCTRCWLKTGLIGGAE